MADRTLVPEFLDTDLSIETASDLSARQYTFVKVDSNEQVVVAGAGDKPLGILQNAPDGSSTPDTAIVRPLGLSKLRAGGSITAQAYLKSDSNGKGVATTSNGDEYGAHAITSGDSGDLIGVVVGNGRY